MMGEPVEQYAENLAFRRKGLFQRDSDLKFCAWAQATNDKPRARLLQKGPNDGHTKALTERYLQDRQLRDPHCPDLLFNEDLSDFETKRGWPGVVARVRDANGEPTGGIHRTYLLDDGSSKASPGKKMLGPVAGGSVRLFPLGSDGELGIAEGVETALSAQAIFSVPTWAALSAEGVRHWQWPKGIKRVTIFADAGIAGVQAAAALSERLSAAGIPSTIVPPLHGDDFNDDLGRGAVVDDYASPRAQSLGTVGQLEAAVRSLTRPPDLQTLGTVLSQLVQARLDPLPERQLLDGIKRSTGISVAILEKQIGELRRRLNATGDIHRQPHRPGWASQLRLDLAGSPERNEANVIIALSNDEAFAGALVFDEFRQEILVVRALPWEERSDLPRPWLDVDDVRCAVWLQHREINVPPAIGAAASPRLRARSPFIPCATTYPHCIGTACLGWNTGRSRALEQKILRSIVRSARAG